MIDAEVQTAYNEQHPEVSEVQQETQSATPETPSLVDPEILDHTPTVDVSPTVTVDKPPLEQIQPDADWFFAEGVPGKGEKPECFNDKTFNTILDQAKAHPQLRKKLASFTGAPEEGYEVTLNEELSTIEMDEDDPLLNQFADLAANMNMSQDGFNELLNFYVSESSKYVQEEVQSQEEYWKTEYDKLGPNGPEDIKLLKQWATHNIPDELRDSFENMITSADHVKIFNMLMDKIIPTQLTHVSAGTGLSRHHLQQMMADAKYGRDPDYTRHVDSEANQLYSIQKRSVYG